MSQQQLESSHSFKKIKVIWYDGGRHIYGRCTKCGLIRELKKPR